MELKNLKDIDVRGKRVLLRVAYDVPLVKKGKKMAVADDSRIRASIPTIRALRAARAKIVICTWLGRPGGEVVEDLKLDPVAEALSRILKQKVRKLNGSTGQEVEDEVSRMKERAVVMLENVRFNKGEEDRDPEYAKALARLADVVVFDAFAQSHRDVPSTTGVLSLLPAVAGLDMVKELKVLSALLEKPAYPFIVILGGAKISDKVETLSHLLSVADCILLGGAMVNNFLKVKGVKIGGSLVEEKVLYNKRQKQTVLKNVEDILSRAEGTYVNLSSEVTIPKLVLPLDLVAASEINEKAESAVIDLEQGEAVQWNWTYLDIGPRTIALYASLIAKAKTIFWNGPLGYVEIDQFSAGSRAIAKAISKSKARSIVGGGDTEGFLKKIRMGSKFTHISTGGGAVLEYLAGKEFPVLKFLKK